MPDRREMRSCLAAGREGNLVYGSPPSRPPQQPTGPTLPGGGYRSTRFRWLSNPPPPDDE
ncbi:predicted protein [Streptomyces sp. AA4]|nr:predicted protein [Streptomyces sp. AA4]